MYIKLANITIYIYFFTFNLKEKSKKIHIYAFFTLTYIKIKHLFILLVIRKKPEMTSMKFCLQQGRNFNLFRKSAIISPSAIT